MKWTGTACICLLLVVGIIFSRCGGKNADMIDTVATPIAQSVNKIHIAEKYYNRKVQLKTRLFYTANGHQRVWLKKKSPDRMFDAFLEEVRASEKFGFNPEDYHADSLEHDVKRLYDNRKRTPDEISRLDMRITASFFLFTTHLLEGRIRYPGAREFLWKRGMPLENDIALLIKMESEQDLRKQLLALHPEDPQYERLQEALALYRKAIPSDTITIPSGSKIAPKTRSKRIPAIRAKLSFTDFKGKPADTSTLYDDNLQKAVVQFQERHGLPADGIIDSETVRLLNEPVSEKAERIALNLERLRWHPHLTGEGDEIVINVPEYVLRVNHNGKEKMKMRVVLGAEYTPTPVFQDTIKYIVFSPTWAVPKSIFEEEFLPKLRDDPEHFDASRFVFYREGQEIDPTEEKWEDKDLDSSLYRVVENPGDANSLGKVKFIMPNDYSIYLHDTPADKLFQRDERALSHGCIRLEKPAELAHYLLADKKGWNNKKIREAMSGEKPVQVNVAKPFPVHIVYRTVWVDEVGLVHFRDDVYGHDKRQIARLKN